MSPHSSIPSDPFTEFIPSRAHPFDDRWIAHLLRRAAFSATIDHFDRHANQTPQQLLDTLLNFDPFHDPLAAASDRLEDFATPFARLPSVQEWAIFRILHTPHPLQERLALFWQYHFSPPLPTRPSASWIHQHLEFYRRHGLGSFRDLLVAAIQDSPMLLWADGRSANKSNPHLIRARQALELFSLSVGLPTPLPIKELAAIFASTPTPKHPPTPPHPSFFSDSPDPTSPTTPSRITPHLAADLILSQPPAPTFLATKLLTEFVHPHPAPDHIAHYAQRLLAHKWHIAPVLREILSSRLFFSPWAYRSKPKTPIDLVIGTAMALGGQFSPRFLRQALASIGHDLLLPSPPFPISSPIASECTNPHILLHRLNLGLTFSPRPAQCSPDQFIAHYARVLLDGQLPPDLRRRLTPLPFSPPHLHSTLRTLLHRMMSTPDFHLS